MTKQYHSHKTDNDIVIKIDYVAFNNCYMVYASGVFQESLDGYDIEDMERLKVWERL